MTADDDHPSERRSQLYAGRRRQAGFLVTVSLESP